MAADSALPAPDEAFLAPSRFARRVRRARGGDRARRRRVYLRPRTPRPTLDLFWTGTPRTGSSPLCSWVSSRSRCSAAASGDGHRRDSGVSARRGLRRHPSTWGPKLGVPQLVQARAAFGYWGNLLPAGLNAVTAGIGWFAVNSISGTFALSTLSGLPFQVSLLIIVAVQVFIAFVGHNFIHRFEQITFPYLVVVFVLAASSSSPTPI